MIVDVAVKFDIPALVLEGEESKSLQKVRLIQFVFYNPFIFIFLGRYLFDTY